MDQQERTRLSSNFVVIPADANSYGNVHGGTIMKQADNLAYALASRYTRKNVVTAHVEEINFLAPVKVGQLVILRAQIVKIGKTSLIVEVLVEGEDLKTGILKEVADAKFVMVAVDENFRPRPIIPIPSQSTSDKKE